ncbi:hypothetical protein AB1Y20_014289 [Prymnesium parvum]|uniref:PHD-type domain-containing protein n=1 Tax=Prymnesium parvum TaxID=97485 RepID=A0AB34IES3_PRYPA
MEPSDSDDDVPIAARAARLAPPPAPPPRLPPLEVRRRKNIEERERYMLEHFGEGWRLASAPAARRKRPLPAPAPARLAKRSARLAERAAVQMEDFELRFAAYYARALPAAMYLAACGVLDGWPTPPSRWFLEDDTVLGQPNDCICVLGWVVAPAIRCVALAVYRRLEAPRCFVLELVAAHVDDQGYGYEDAMEAYIAQVAAQAGCPDLWAAPPCLPDSGSWRERYQQGAEPRQLQQLRHARAASHPCVAHQPYSRREVGQECVPDQYMRYQVAITMLKGVQKHLPVQLQEAKQMVETYCLAWERAISQPHHLPSAQGSVGQLEPGELVGLWHSTDLQHMAALLEDSYTELKASTQAATACETAAGAHLPMEAEQKRFFFSLPYEAASSVEVVHMALEFKTIAHASCQEISLASGIGVDEDGREYSAKQYTWFYLAARVGSPAWASLCDERRAVGPPQLKAYWHRPELLLNSNLRPDVVLQRALALSRQLAKANPERDLWQRRQAPPQSKFYMLEAFAGSAPLSRVWTAAPFGHHAQFLDWCKDDNDTGDVRVKPPMFRCVEDENELELQDLIPIDWLDLDLHHIERFICGAPKGEITGEGERQETSATIREGALHWVHLAFECRTFSHLNQGPSGNDRGPSNSFMGTSVLAYKANVRLLHAAAFAQLMLRRNPMMVITLENPLARLQHHPLITHMFERERSKGGLGLIRAQFHFCAFKTECAKPSHLWGPENVINDFVNEVGEPKWACWHRGKHAEQVRGNTSDVRREITAYPKLFAWLLVTSVDREVRRHNFLTSLRADGSWDHCAICLNPNKPVERHSPCCSICPRSFHAECIAQACPSTSEAWLCPNCSVVGNTLQM